jgi:hypothetical protein
MIAVYKMEIQGLLLIKKIILTTKINYNKEKEWGRAQKLLLLLL